MAFVKKPGNLCLATVPVSHQQFECRTMRPSGRRMIVGPWPPSATARSAPRHTPAVEELYRRMLRAADARGRFVSRSVRAPRPHCGGRGHGLPVVHLHGTNTSSLSHLMLPGRTPGIHSYLVDRTWVRPQRPRVLPPRRVSRTLRRLRPGHAGCPGPRWRPPRRCLRRRHLGHLVRTGPPGAGTWTGSCSAPCRPCPVAGCLLPLRLAATPGIGDLRCGAVKPGRRMLLTMMASVGEAETIVRHPDLLDSLVAGARDPVAAKANYDELPCADLTPRLPNPNAARPRGSSAGSPYQL